MTHASLQFVAGDWPIKYQPLYCYATKVTDTYTRLVKHTLRYTALHDNADPIDPSFVEDR